MRWHAVVGIADFMYACIPVLDRITSSAMPCATLQQHRQILMTDQPCRIALPAASVFTLAGHHAEATATPCGHRERNGMRNVNAPVGPFARRNKFRNRLATLGRCPYAPTTQQENIAHAFEPLSTRDDVQ